MSVTKEFQDAVLNKNLLRVKIMLKDSLLIDTTFCQFDDMIHYAETRLSNIWIRDEEDDAIFSQEAEALNAILAGLVNNFSRRRVIHLKRMISRIYPPAIKNKQTDNKKMEREIRQTRKPVYREICNNAEQIEKICSQISRKGKGSKEDIDKIRGTARHIIEQCRRIQESR